VRGVGRWWAAVLAGSLLPASAAAQLALLARPETGARATALGGAAVAAPPGADAATWNPAALGGATRGEMLFEHRGAGSGLTLQSASATVHATPRFDLALRAHLLHRDGIAAAEAVGSASGTPALSAYMAGLQAAFDVGHGVHVGAGMGRATGFPIGNDRPNAWCADAGIQAQWRDVRAAAALRGMLLGAHGTSEGSAWSAGIESPVPRTRLTVALQMDAAESAAMSSSAGLICKVAPAMELRAGARGRDGEGPVFGAGAAFGAGEARLEYGARIATGAATEHVIAARIGFGGAPPIASRPSVAPKPTPLEATAPPLPAIRKPVESTARPIAVKREPVAPPVAPVAPSAAPPPAPAPVSAPPGPAPKPPVARRFTVFAGPYPSLDVAARDAMRLRSAGMRPTVERRGAQVFLMLERGAESARAHQLEVQARAAQVTLRREAE